MSEAPAMREPCTVARAAGDDPLDYVDITHLETIVREHLPPAVHQIALKWADLGADAMLIAFIDALEPHLRDQVPDFPALATHVLAHMDSVERMCAEVGGQEDHDATTA